MFIDQCQGEQAGYLYHLLVESVALHRVLVHILSSINYKNEYSIIHLVQHLMERPGFPDMARDVCNTRFVWEMQHQVAR